MTAKKISQFVRSGDIMKRRLVLILVFFSFVSWYLITFISNSLVSMGRYFEYSVQVNKADKIPAGGIRLNILSMISDFFTLKNTGKLTRLNFISFIVLLAVLILIAYIFSLVIVKPYNLILNQIEEVKEGSCTKISSGSSLFSEMTSKINLLVEKLKSEKQESDESYKRKESSVIQASEDLKKLAADIKGYTDVLIETKKNDSYELKLLNEISESADSAEIILNQKKEK